MFRPKAWIKPVGKKIRVFGLSKIMFFYSKKGLFFPWKVIKHYFKSGFH